MIDQFKETSNRNLPIQNVRELFDYAQRNPGQGFIGAFGSGGTADLSIQLLRNAGGTHLAPVTYKDDAGPMIDTVGGRLVGTVGTGSTIRRFAQTGGGVRIIGILADERLQGWEDVPTVGEQLPGFKPLRTFTGIFEPARLPAEIVKRLNETIARALAEPAVRAPMIAAGSIVKSSTPEELGQLVKSELERVAPVLKQAGIQPE